MVNISREWRQYSAEKGIPRLIEEIVNSLGSARPNNTKAHVAEFLEQKREEQKGSAQEVLRCWQSLSAQRKEWWSLGTGAEGDSVLQSHRDQLAGLARMHLCAMQGELDSWAEDRRIVALIVLLQIYPFWVCGGKGEAYQSLNAIIKLVKRSLALGVDSKLSMADRELVYLPLCQSENIDDQEVGWGKMLQLGGEPSALAAARREVVQRYGRFPERNEILGRHNALTEEIYLGKRK